MKKSKLLFMNILVIVSLILLSACGSSNNSSSSTANPEATLTPAPAAKTQAPAKEVTISLYIAESLLASKTDDFVKKFEATHPNIKVKAEIVPDGDVYTKLQVKVTTGEMPD